MFELDYVTYARVAPGAASTDAVLRSTDDGVKAFLEEHVTKLDALARSRDSSAGRFTEDGAKALFRDLSAGSEAQFLAAASALTKRLVAEMNGRTAAGLLVALRARADSELIAGVLKLEVVAEHAAVLEELDSGEVELSAATNMMDKPGELKKGALTRSTLEGNQVMVGDRLQYDAAYFPRAFGIQIYARPSEATRELFKAIGELAPDLLGPVAQHLSELSPGEVGDVLQALSDRVPGLTEDVRLRLLDQLANLTRPAGRIDTQGKYRQILNVGPIQVSGPVADMQDRITVTQTGDGRWRVTIDSAERPDTSYRS
ncbi:nucleoid-associated protein [Flindersiella endophytica]